MALVDSEERAAAASFTTAPRALAAAFSPMISGALLSASVAGWPFAVGGALKIAYDLLLIRGFRGLEPAAEEPAPTPPAGPAAAP
jgi:hypothetical protein